MRDRGVSSLGTIQTWPHSTHRRYQDQTLVDLEKVNMPSESRGTLGKEDGVERAAPLRISSRHRARSVRTATITR
jgi:hypothetical protein